MKPFYEDAAGEKLTALLKEHFTTAAEFVAAAKMKDEAKQKEAKRRWYANGDENLRFSKQRKHQALARR